MLCHPHRMGMVTFSNIPAITWAQLLPCFKCLATGLKIKYFWALPSPQNQVLSHLLNKSSSARAVQGNHLKHSAWPLYYSLGLEKSSPSFFTLQAPAVCSNTADPLTWSIPASNPAVLIFLQEPKCQQILINRSQHSRPSQQVEALWEGGCLPPVSLLQTSPHPATDQIFIIGFMRLKSIVQHKALPEDGEHLVEATVDSSTTVLRQMRVLPSLLYAYNL